LHRNNKSRNGFTLVELSIVLVIVGLLTSGILVGKDMIRAAELRSITTEKEQIQTAVMLFENKYFGLPGDITNATSFWGSMTGTCPTNVTAQTGTQTCNGDGDGIVTGMKGGSTLINDAHEFLIFWQHLSNAGLIAGTFKGFWPGWSEYGTGGYVSKVGKNATWAGGGYAASTVLISDISRFEGNYGNTISLRDNINYIPILTPSEVWNIDKKIDDGLPGMGKMVTLESGGVNCNNVAASNSVALAQTATYNLSSL
jgi:prepilin-type N-terminal cleavage/methylation domain-containing protein